MGVIVGKRGINGKYKKSCGIEYDGDLWGFMG